MTLRTTVKIKKQVVMQINKILLKRIKGKIRKNKKSMLMLRQQPKIIAGKVGKRK